MPSAQDVIRIAAAEVGTTESPAGSNRQKYSAELGRPAEPWCADFVVWVMRKAGIKLPSESAYTPTMAQGFKSAGSWYGAPKPGDVGLLNFGSGIIRHAVLVVGVNQDGSVITIEGNTSAGDAGSQDNGGGVFRRIRPAKYVVGYGRPAYSIPKEIRPMYSPALALEPIVADLACPTGGAWLLAASGAVYGFGGAPYLGAPNGKDYFAGRTAARLEPITDGGVYKYRVISVSGESYGPGF